MYHFIHFKMYNSEALKYIDKRTVYNHHHHPSPELFHFPHIETLYPLKSNSPSCLSSSLAATILPPVSISLSYSRDFLEYLSFVYGLFNIMSSRFNHVVAHVRMCFLFKAWMMFHHMYRPHFVYPYICGWTLGLLPPLGYCDNAMTVEVQVSAWVCAFSSFGGTPRSGNCWLNGDSKLNFPRKLHTTFHSGCTTHSHQDSKVLLSPYAHQHLAYSILFWIFFFGFFFLIIIILMDAKWYLSHYKVLTASVCDLLKMERE